MNEKEDIYKKVERDEYVELILKLFEGLKEDYEKEIDKLKMDVAELEKERGKHDARIAWNADKLRAFDDYIDLKTKGRRDYDNLSIELKDEIVRRRRKGMDYRDVVILFRFKTNEEAYRVMERAIKNFPEDVKMREIKNSNKRKKILCPR